MSTRQKLALERGLMNYQLPLDTGVWDYTMIFGRVANTVIEIGFGMGDSLVAMAKACPDVNYIGIEVHRAGIGSLVARLDEEGIGNVRVAPYDALDVLNICIQDASLSGVQIFFPDPWPKLRHHKRRLVQPPFIDLLTQKLKKDGWIHCATDWEDYALQMMSVMSAVPLLTNVEGDGCYLLTPSRPLTKFERRGQALGHGVWDLKFVRLA